MQLNRIAVVTGAASGMGEATAQLLHEAGWQLLLCDLSESRLRESAAAYAKPEEVSFIAGDIATSDFLTAFNAAIDGREIGAMVHCAGISPTMGSPERILEVNLAATMRLADAALPHMAADSAVVLFASSSGHMMGTVFDERIDAADTQDKVAALLEICPNEGVAYGVSKRGVILLAKREAPRFGAKGVRLVSLSPGIIDTPMGRQEMENSPIMQTLVERSALPRSAKPREVGTVARFLCSCDASFITGTDILVDGGSLSRGRPTAPAA
ncbi:MAG TPA: SDR family oxidoreductase [Sphingobium sp.]|uniref:SDR family NAD(P)-dependent oxidoreductase n=1 Tax=Sphingobium sp. TaxID=1912891 RepID=UPI002ED3854B